MKKVFVLFVISLIVLNLSAQKSKPKPVTQSISSIIKPPAQVPKSLLDSFSYMAGYNVATNMKEQGITSLNTVMMQKGIYDYFNNILPLIPPQIGYQCLQRQLDIFNKVKAEVSKKKADSIRAKGVAYLENNKKRKEVTTLPDGLQYEIIKAADSITNKPHTTDTVVVNYIGSLIDGKEFDNSYKRGQPAVFAADRVIKGWTEILQLMSVGAHWKVYIPTELGYGDNPPPGANIAPGDALVFEIILEGIKPFAEKPKQ